MKMKVIRAVVVYNGEVYHEGDSVEVDNEKERQMMIRERCAVQSQVIEEETNKSTEKTHYVPSGDAIEEIVLSTEGKTKGKGRGRR